MTVVQADFKLRTRQGLNNQTFYLNFIFIFCHNPSAFSAV